MSTDKQKMDALRKLEQAVGAGVEINGEELMYQESLQGEQVRVFFYPDTPIGFYDVKATTLDEAIEELIKLQADL